MCGERVDAAGGLQNACSDLLPERCTADMSIENMMHGHGFS